MVYSDSHALNEITAIRALPDKTSLHCATTGMDISRQKYILPYPSTPSQLLSPQNRRPLVVVGGARSEDATEVLNGFESRAAPASRPPPSIQADAGVSAAAEAVVYIYNGAKAPVAIAAVVGGSWADTDEEPPVPICCRPWVGAASTWWTLH